MSTSYLNKIEETVTIATETSMQGAAEQLFLFLSLSITLLLNLLSNAQLDYSTLSIIVMAGANKEKMLHQLFKNQSMPQIEMDYLEDPLSLARDLSRGLKISHWNVKVSVLHFLTLGNSIT